MAPPMPEITETVLVALVGLIGVLAGVWQGRKTSREGLMVQRNSAEVAGLRSLVDALTERVAALERALAAAEASAETAAHVRAEAEARAWHALAHARALTAWADTVTAIVPDTVSLPPRPPNSRPSRSTGSGEIAAISPGSPAIPHSVSVERSPTSRSR